VARLVDVVLVVDRAQNGSTRSSSIDHDVVVVTQLLDDHRLAEERDLVLALRHCRVNAIFFSG
jgi:hypothetical protein